jgi:lipopolysaccharide transport system ATP-binding protein
MSSIKLEGCTVDMPVYGIKNRSIKGAFLSASTGGRIASEAGDITVIRALSEVTLSISSGERVGLCGHNGAGKTTLLRLLAGMYEPTSGKVFVEGKIASMLDMSLGMDHESTGYENIRLMGLIYGMSLKEIAKKTPEIAEFSGLGDYLKLPIRVYSSGMIVRLAFSVVSSMKADIILMDEWLSVGDADFSHSAEERLRAMISDAKILVLATHNKSLIDTVCNRSISLEKGSIVEDLFLM